MGVGLDRSGMVEIITRMRGAAHIDFSTFALSESR